MATVDSELPDRRRSALPESDRLGARAPTSARPDVVGFIGNTSRRSSIGCISSATPRPQASPSFRSEAFSTSATATNRPVSRWHSWSTLDHEMWRSESANCKRPAATCVHWRSVLLPRIQQPAAVTVRSWPGLL